MAFQLPFLPENKYVLSLITLVTFYIASQLVVFISEKIILRLTKKTKTEIDDLIIKKANKPISLILLLWGLRLALKDLALAENVEANISRVTYTIIVVIITYIVIGVFDIIIDQWGRKFSQRTHSKIDNELLTIFHRSSRIIFAILGLLYILHLWGIEIGPLLASLGIAGVAIAFALQNTLGNIFGGISLIIDKSVKKGDVISLDSGESGTVYEVGLRSTKIKTWNNEMVIVPNGKLSSSTIKNLSQPDLSTRVDIEFNVEYGSDTDRVKKIILDATGKIKGVLKEPAPDIFFLEMGDFALKFKLMFWIDDLSKKWAVHQEVIAAIYTTLNKHKIGIPFPTRTVYVKK